MEKSFRNLSKLFRHLANILDLATSEDHIQKMVSKFRLFGNKKSQVHIYIHLSATLQQRDSALQKAALWLVCVVCTV